MAQPAPYHRGFQTLESEISADDLPVTGNMPTWLRGTLVRNGPGRFELAHKTYNHWFDGLAMLHRFTVADGAVSYANRYLQSRDHHHSTTEGKPHMRAFATDPCMGVFGRVMSIFDANMTDNANINVAKLADRFVAMTETPHAVEFDPVTLTTKGAVAFQDHVLANSATTAHPHYDAARGQWVNFGTRFGVPNCNYRVYTFAPGDDQRQIVGQIPVPQPAYMHSFSTTPRYAILSEYPYVARTTDIAFSGRAFIENYTWEPSRGTRFWVMDRETGAVHDPMPTDAFFCFHHVNAYEADDDTLVVDLVAYDDITPVTSLYLDVIRNTRESLAAAAGELRRYVLNLRTGEVTWTRVGDELMELPRVNTRYAMQPYTTAYGIGVKMNARTGFANQLVKMDVNTGASQTWYAEGCYPGEPVFAAAPDATNETDGVLLSVVLDVARDRSFLLVLDAATMHEMARAEVPHAIPFGFHGQFYGGVG